MKLLGLSFGTKMGNNEVLIKEALMAAGEIGNIEVGFIRMLDLDIKPCRGCTVCARSFRQGGDGKCVIKDDLPLVDEQVMQSDGLIIGAPIYVLAPPGLYKSVADRWGPSHDMAWRIEAQKIALAKGKKGLDERVFKRRVGGFMCTGGAATPHWLSLGLPLMNLLTFSSHIAIVDQLAVFPLSRMGHITLNRKILERARKLGRHVAQAMGKPEKQLKWRGDSPGTCPVCHSNLLTVTDKNPVECPICGIAGELKVSRGKITVTFSEAEQARSRLTIAGKKEHWDELAGTAKFMAIRQQKAAEIEQNMKIYKGYAEIKLK